MKKSFKEIMDNGQSIAEVSGEPYALDAILFATQEATANENIEWTYYDKDNKKAVVKAITKEPDRIRQRLLEIVSMVKEISIEKRAKAL